MSEESISWVFGNASWDAGLAVLFLFICFFGARWARKGEYWSDPFSKNQGLALRGIFACVVVFHHLVLSKCSDSFLFTRFAYFGHLSVAVFFSLSGYGLMRQLNSNNDYMRGFWPTRLKKLLPAYVVMTCLALVQGIRGDFNVWHRMTIQLGVVDAGWYCPILSILYFIFWIGNLWKSTNDETTPAFAIMGVLIWTSISSLFLGQHAYIRNGAFVVGLLVGWKPDEAFSFLKKHKYMLMGLGAWLAMFQLTYGMAELPNSMAKFITCAMWVLVVVAISMKVQFGNAVLRYLGMISYEIYLSHMFVLGELQHWFPQRQSSWMVFATIAGTLATATALHWIIGKVFPAHKIRTA